LSSLRPERLIAIALVAFTIGCGGSSSNSELSTPASAVTITPSSASLAVGQQQQFTATVTGSTNPAVTWQVNGVVGGNTTTGTITSSGLYTATAIVPTGQVTVTAVAQADAGASASAGVFITSASTTGLVPLVDLATGFYSPGTNSSGAPCNGSNGCTPVNFEGGLYGSGANSPASAQDADGKSFASSLQALQNTQEVIAFCIGMSIMEQNCGRLVSDYNASSLVKQDPQLHFFDTAQPGYNACLWAYWNPVDGPGTTPNVPSTCPRGTYPNPPYIPINTVNLPAIQSCGPNHNTACGVNDVRVVIWQDADAQPTNGLPCTGSGTPAGTYFKDYRLNSFVPCSGLGDAYQLEQFMAMAARSVRYNYPNCVLMLIVSRNYSGYSLEPLNPEPYAYEAGFAAQFLMKAQAAQCTASMTCSTTPGDNFAGDLSYVATSGNACGGSACAPLILWAGYTWANGTTPRGSDGLIWCDASYTPGQSGPPCEGEEDYLAAGNPHASPDGSKKWSSATQSIPGTSGSWPGVLGNLLNGPYTKPWFHN
jgi:hypothetical protein